MARDDPPLREKLGALCIETVIANRKALADVLNQLPFDLLPSIVIDTVDLGPRLPNVACVYFLTHPDQGLLYVGRAVALSQRFEVPKNIYQQRMWDLAHAWLYPCYRLGNVRLSWWTIPSDFIEEVESAAIKILHPRLNERGRASLRDRDLTERLQDLVRGNPPPSMNRSALPKSAPLPIAFPSGFLVTADLRTGRLAKRISVASWPPPSERAATHTATQC